MTAGYAFASVVARAFVNHAWPADVRGSETDYVGGGLVTDLPIEPFRTDPDHVWVRPPLDVVFSDRLEAVARRGRADAAVGAALRRGSGVLGGAQPAGAGQLHGSDAPPPPTPMRASPPRSTRCCAFRGSPTTSRSSGATWSGSFKTADEIERRLQTWLIGYVNSNLAGGPESRARFPLVAGRVHGARAIRTAGRVRLHHSCCNRIFSSTTCRRRSAS